MAAVAACRKPGGRQTNGSCNVSSKDLEGLHPHRIYSALFPFCAGSLRPAATPTPRRAGRAAEAAAPWQRRCVSFEDLDDLHPCLMYGALLSFLKAWGNSLAIVAPALLSWRLALALLVAASAVHAVLPVATIVQGGAVLIALGEGTFFVWLRIVRREVQRLRPLADRPQAPAGGPDSVFRKTIACVEECASWSRDHGTGRDPTEWLEAWFLGMPLARILQGNMLEFLSWAFFTRTLEELGDDGRGKVRGMLQEMEGRFGWAFAAGFDPSVKPMRINFDHLHVWCHPLLYYCGTLLLRVGTRHTLRLCGYAYRESGVGTGRRLSYFHHAPAQPVPGLATVNGAPLARRAKPPIVFIHGLGVGLSPYLRLIRRLTNGSRECFVVELPEVSQTGTRVVLPPDAMAEEIAAMLRAHGHQSACFVAHSYGTFVLSWVLRTQREMVAQLVLLDPVCFLLAQPDVAYNFLYRPPRTTFSLVVANFVRWELFSANVLMRHFYWYHNVMWREELPLDTVVAMSGKDDITDPCAVRRYLEACPRHGDDPKRQLKLLWFDNFFHGEILLSKIAQVQVMELM